jgi:hypothetical protein
LAYHTPTEQATQEVRSVCGENPDSPLGNLRVLAKPG